MLKRLKYTEISFAVLSKISINTVSNYETEIPAEKKINKVYVDGGKNRHKEHKKHAFELIFHDKHKSVNAARSA